MQVDTKLVRELAELLDTSHLTEIEVKDGERSIRVARTVTAAPVNYTAPAPTAGPSTAAPASAAAAAPSGDIDWKSHPGLVKCPLVGTAYLTPEPGAAPFITEGADVKAGQTLIIVEAMKVMNPITAPRAGKVVKILIRSEQPVEYDEPLVVIE
ncbi:acetyl-CoA carboxylase biotin carboxyl carrier protein [Polymorphobacter sp.]|uniref:acetyl-CoA carboxylase biotin carboxyl carrier protein n=1 Tax=Polymorphobacter sp. TaxID=1909290 RepID=UPI003F6FB088